MAAAQSLAGPKSQVPPSLVTTTAPEGAILLSWNFGHFDILQNVELTRAFYYSFV